MQFASAHMHWHTCACAADNKCPGAGTHAYQVCVPEPRLKCTRTRARTRSYSGARYSIRACALALRRTRSHSADRLSIHTSGLARARMPYKPFGLRVSRARALIYAHYNLRLSGRAICVCVLSYGGGGGGEHELTRARVCVYSSTLVETHSFIQLLFGDVQACTRGTPNSRNLCVLDFGLTPVSVCVCVICTSVCL